MTEKGMPTQNADSVQHEVCGWTGTGAARAYAEVSSVAQSKEREVAQVTFSTIGDVSVAASEAMAARAPKETTWKPIVVFSLVVYTLSVGLAWLLSGTSPWLVAVLAPLLPVLCATLAFWRRQQWKFRAQNWKFKFKIWEDALDSFGYEAANAVNAIRANLIGFRLANPHVPMAEHLDVIQEETKRIERVLQKAQDPVAWKGKKKQEKEKPGLDVDDTRSRINL